MADSIPATEGYIDYTPSTVGKRCQTWYKAYGDLKSGGRPLVIAHGGPGLSHDYMVSLTDLAQAPYNIPLVFYDQIGSGRSTALPEKFRDYGFWNEQLFLDELTALLTQLGIQGDYDLLGHSWGGMLSSTHAARQPLGLRRLCLVGTPVSSAAWSKAYRRYREGVPEQQKEVLMRPREFGVDDTPEYKEAIGAFMEKHMCGISPMPAECEKSFAFADKDPTVLLSTLGPSEFDFVGFTMTWSVANELHKIKMPTLLINGADEGADDESLELFDAGIANSTWVKFENSRHMHHWEERERFMKVVGQWLKAE